MHKLCTIIRNGLAAGGFSGFVMMMLVVAALAVTVSTSAHAYYTLTDANSSVIIDPLSPAGMTGWAVDNVNQLKTEWWYYRVGQNAPMSIETIGAPTVTQGSPNSLNVLFSGPLMDVTLRYTLLGGASGTGNSTIAQSVRMRNKSTSPLDFHLYEYNDLDLMGTPDDDTVVHVNSASICQWDGARIATETSSIGGITPVPTHWEIGQYSSILDKLYAGMPYDLMDGVDTLDNANATFAFQWDFNIGAGATQLLSKSKILMRSGSIGDTVWFDKNADGVKQDDEAGISNVKVSLDADIGYDGTIDYSTSTTTDANGYYLFANLPGGQYTITVDSSTLPGGVVQTYDYDGVTTPNTASLDLGSGEVNLDADFGYKGICSLAGVVWHDDNADGKRDAGEVLYPDVPLSLKDSGGNVIGNTTTDANGAYSFTDLPAGTYTVSVETPPAGQVQTYDLDLTLDNSTTITLNSGDNRTDLDFGYTGNHPGIAIEKTGPATAKVGETITYHFKVTNTGDTYFYGGATVNDPMLGGVIWHKTPVAPGEVNEFDRTYVVKACDPEVLVNTATAIGCPPLGGTVTDTDSWTITTQRSINASIAGVVFRDANANGKKEASDTGMASIPLVLKDSSGNIVSSTFTNSSGAYTFNGLSAGTYIVSVAPPPAGYKQTYDLDGVLDSSTKVVLSSGQKLTNVDFGYTGTKPGVCLVKTGPCTAKVGDTIKFHFKVTNTGNTFLYGGVTINDPMLGGDIWHKTPVAPGEVNEFDYAYVVKACDPACLVNTATAIGCPPIGCKVTDTSSWTVKIERCTAHLTTYTQGGWGSCPCGNNPGALLKNNFKKVYPCGIVKLGGKYTLTFTSSCAISSFLPQGSCPGVLKQSYTNPGCRTTAGVFAGQVLALKLNVDFSNAGVTGQGLAGVKIQTGKFAGKTIGEILALAERVLGGDTCALPKCASVSDLNATVTYINEMFDH